MNPTVSLIFNQDGTYDLILNYERNGVEFSKEFDLKKEAHKISKSIFSNIKKCEDQKCKNFSFRCDCYNACFLHFFKRSCRIRPLYHGIFVQRHRPPADRVYQSDEQRVRRCIPQLFRPAEDGSLKLNYLSPFFIKSMHDKGIKVVPFLSNHWNRTAGINALKNIESLSTKLPIMWKNMI